ncbi:hypothetical protein [Duganella callida]|uniref:Uncharacterized protein n=1 Tax=Duganella callida TaxID=2561932 RepID=A0A4Y9T224_9BURK|nr:hypothetical protein [Duganella callida]TFW31061.1 hypothetical protein E4L98_01185 [Duganella callida]
MAGQKTFINNTPRDISLTLSIRAGDNPANTAGQQTITIRANSQARVTYGNDSNIYLNGLSVVAVGEDGVFGEQEFVVTRGAPIDNLLNMNSVVVLNGGFVQLTSHN